MKLRRRRRVKAFPQKRSQLGGCGLLPAAWGCGAMPRPVHLAGQRLRRRPDKCDAGCRRHKLHITRFRRCRRQKLAHSAAPPSSRRNRFAGSPVGGGDKNSHFTFFRHFYVGGVSLPSGRFVCVGTTRRGVCFSRKNGFLRVGALRRWMRAVPSRTQCFFGSSVWGVVSLPSVRDSCC